MTPDAPLVASDREDRRAAFGRFCDAVRRTLEEVARSGGYSDADITTLHRAAREAFRTEGSTP